MAYIKMKDYKSLKDAAKNGDAKAVSIIQKLASGDKQENLDRLIHDYYNPQPATPVKGAKEAPAPIQESSDDEMDISKLLDGELDGVVDEDEVPDVSFSDFLKNKKRDAVRSKKNPDYFKAFDPNGRSQYLQNKKDGYNHKFDVNRKDIERGYRDMDGAISQNIQSVNDLADDGIEMDMNVASQAYDGMTDDDDFMHGFNRSWDDEDKATVQGKLAELCRKYGKKNILAALNSMKGDNDAYHNFRNSQINDEVGRYGKSLDKLLK